jgi:hypothetical protein
VDVDPREEFLIWMLNSRSRCRFWNWILYLDSDYGCGCGLTSRFFNQDTGFDTGYGF